MMKKLNLKIIIPVIGIIIGIITVFMGLTTHEFNYSYNGFVFRETYGGDAYTGIQNACAQVTTNTYHIYELIQTFSKIFFVIVGLLTILHYVEKLFENIKVLKNESRTLDVE